MEVSGVAQRSFKHAAHIAGEAGSLGDGGQALPSQETARLAQLDTEYANRVPFNQLGGGLYGLQAFICHDGDVGALVDADQGVQLRLGDRLLNEIQVVGLKQGAGPQRLGFIPALVGVCPEPGLGQGLPDAPDALGVLFHTLQAGFEFENEI